MGTVQDLKRVSLRMFAKHGYEGTTLSEIASEVGIKKPSIYAHFQGKKELFLTVFEEVLAEQVMHIKKKFFQNTADIPVHDKLFGVLHDLCTFYLTNPDKHTFLKRSLFFPPKELEPELRAKFLASEQALSVLLKGIFQEALDSGIVQAQSIDDLLASFYCLIDGCSMQLLYYGQESFLVRLKNNWNVYWSGLINQTRVIESVAD